VHIIAFHCSSSILLVLLYRHVSEQEFALLSHPATWTQNNIAHMRSRLQQLGIDYHWSHELQTNDPAYYKWQQWLFLAMYKKGYEYSLKKSSQKFKYFKFDCFGSIIHNTKLKAVQGETTSESYIYPHSTKET
jgi:leucyl-tRNA synthetase